MDGGAIDIVLFDLGGVLIDFGGVGPMRTLARIDSDDELWRRWLTCRWVRRFESGRCSAEEFATGVVGDWELDLTPQAFLDAFGTWPGEPLPGAAALMQTVKESVTVGCLSNTNALHWHLHRHRWPILDSFDLRFLSFELGMVKPDTAVFERVRSMVPTSADRVLFLDDNAVNVEAAAASGFRAAHVAGVAGAHQALIEFAVLSPPIPTDARRRRPMS